MVRPRPQRPRPQANAPDSGYAAVDALVALIILTFAIVASLNAIAQGRRLSRAALETRQAQALTGHLLNTLSVATPPGASTGRARGFDWTLTVDEPVRTYGAGALCERRVRLVGVATHRIYAASTAEICPDDNHEAMPGDGAG